MRVKFNVYGKVTHTLVRSFSSKQEAAAFCSLFTCYYFKQVFA